MPVYIDWIRPYPRCLLLTEKQVPIKGDPTGCINSRFHVQHLSSKLLHRYILQNAIYQIAWLIIHISLFCHDPASKYMVRKTML